MFGCSPRAKVISLLFIKSFKNTVYRVTSFWIVLTVNVIPSITTFFEVMLIGTGIGDGMGNWVSDRVSAGDTAGVDNVCTRI
jgi:uncharacterized membrane protein